MNPLGWLSPSGQLLTAEQTYSSQGYTYSMPYYGDAVMNYELGSQQVKPPIVTTGSGCLLSLFGIFGG